MWYMVYMCNMLYTLNIMIHFQGEWFSEVEVIKLKPKEVVTAAQVVQDVKEVGLQTPHCVTTVTCQYKGMSLVISDECLYMCFCSTRHDWYMLNNTQGHVLQHKNTKD